eukprot:scaffold350617_cov15-Prasinocladus_malaysianus.AAC.1
MAVFAVHFSGAVLVNLRLAAFLIYHRQGLRFTKWMFNFCCSDDRLVSNCKVSVKLSSKSYLLSQGSLRRGQLSVES